MVHDIPGNAGLFGSALRMYGFDSEVEIVRYGLEAVRCVRQEGRRMIPSPRGSARFCRGGGG